MADAHTIEQVDRLLRVEHFDEAARARIAELGDNALDVLRSRATGSTRGEAGFLRSRAILALADWPDGEVLDTLDEVLDGPDGDDRMRATMTLGELGTAAAVRRLSAFADRTDRDLEMATVARTLATMAAPEARAALDRMRPGASAMVQAEIDAALDD